MFKLEPSKYPNEMPSIYWQGQSIRASQFGDSEFMAACETIGRFSRANLLRIWTAYADNKIIMQGNRRSGEPYHFHPSGNALIGMLELGNVDVDSVIADLMHDNKEDSDFFQGHKSLVGEFEIFTPLDMLSVRYGEKAAKIILAVTKPSPPLPKKDMDPTMKDRYLRWAYNRVVNLFPEVRREAVWTKIRDRIFNLRTEGNQEKLANNLVDTIRFILPMTQFVGEEYDVLLRSEINKNFSVLTLEQKTTKPIVYTIE